jgi:ADP-ribose pyrophosphatase
VQQYRAPIGRLTLEIPAGKFDHVGEDPLLCAQRELSEETGYIADSWRKLTVLETTPGFCNEIIYLYLAQDLDFGDAQPDEDEFVEVERIPLSRAVELVMNNEIYDAKTQIAVLKTAALLKTL